jgi:hypothetical protein
MARIARLVASVFDLHTWSKPLADADLGPDFRFMATPAEHRAMRVAGASRESANFRVFPIYSKASRNTFWRRYVNALDLAREAADDRDWLIPLRARPKSLAPTLTVPGLAAPVKVYVTVWLWPFGWSSQLEMRVGRHGGLDEVETITSALTGAATPFALAGKALSTSGLFAAVARAVVGDVVSPDADPQDVLRVQRRAVFGLVAEQGQIVEPFDPPSRRSDLERARIASLLGRTVDVVEVNQIGQPGSAYRLTPLGRPEFALTHNQLGAVVMLRHPLDSGPLHTRSRQFCLLGNIRASLLAWAALSAVGTVGRNTPLAQAAAGARDALRDSCHNRVFQDYVR